MFRPRVIPVLLLSGSGLVKTVKFKNPKYIGDPINAVKIFNDLEADELVFLDITATNQHRTISSSLIKDIGDEAYMPFAAGGGIKNLNDIREILSYGAEKVVLNSCLMANHGLVSEAAGKFGSQSIIVSIDVRRNVFGGYKIYTKSGSVKINSNLTDFCCQMQELGAGEILINSIDNDGVMSGYDYDLIKLVSNSVSIPVIACGGAGNLNDFSKAVFDSGASAVAAGSMFVFHGPRRAVLINYPPKKELMRIFKKNE